MVSVLVSLHIVYNIYIYGQKRNHNQMCICKAADEPPVNGICPGRFAYSIIYIYNTVYLVLFNLELCNFKVQYIPQILIYQHSIDLGGT